MKIQFEKGAGKIYTTVCNEITGDKLRKFKSEIEKLFDQKITSVQSESYEITVSDIETTLRTI